MTGAGCGWEDIHGPGGIGKTSLLLWLASLAEDADAAVVPIDGQDLAPQPGAVLDALARTAYLEVGDGNGPISASVSPERHGRGNPLAARWPLRR